jgi:radical SAM-linked protein
VVPSGIPTARQASAAPGQQVAFVPSGLRLPNGTRAPVIPVGVAADGALEIPEDPAEVGVWNGGARAGDTLGSLVIAGHVDSRVHGLGVLYELKGVRPGAVIELSDGKRRQRYTVSSTRYVNQQSLATDDEFFRQDVDARLVVITCGGPFDPAKRRYRDNYIVLAIPS